MPQRNCPLCSVPCEPCDSHLIAAGFYSITREGCLDGEAPVVIGGGSALMSDSQARAWLLCSSCEQRFNREGEDWVIENCWHRPGRFRLREALERAQPIATGPDFVGYHATSLPGVDVGKLVYFATSVFWRAAVSDWRLGKRIGAPLPFGPYAPMLREYLLGAAPFPDRAVLVCVLTMDQSEMHNRVIKLPWMSNRESTHRGYEFFVPGISFKLLVGQRFPFAKSRVCLDAAGLITVASSVDDIKLKQMVTMVSSSTRRGKLAN